MPQKNKPQKTLSITEKKQNPHFYEKKTKPSFYEKKTKTLISMRKNQNPLYPPIIWDEKPEYDFLFHAYF